MQTASFATVFRSWGGAGKFLEGIQMRQNFGIWAGVCGLESRGCWIGGFRRVGLAVQFGLMVGLALSAFSGGALWGQVVATYTGPNGNWSNPANWDVGVVPINNGPNTYNVIVPAGKIITFDIPGANTISGLNLVNTGRINIAEGRSLNVSGFTLVEGIVTADGTGSGFIAVSPLTVFQPSPQMHSSNGGVIQIAGTQYETQAGIGLSAPSTLVGISADGDGSIIDLSSLQSFTNRAQNANGGGIFRVLAENHGQIDLSGVETIDGGASSASLSLRVRSEGNIDLSNLTTVTAIAGGSKANSWLDVDIPFYGLPLLEQANRMFLNPGLDTQLNLPALTRLTNGRITLAGNAVMDAPGLTDVSGTIVTVSGSSAQLNTAPLQQIQSSEFHALDGASISTGSQNYTIGIGLPLEGSGAFFPYVAASAIGPGSMLEMASINFLDSISNDANGTGVLRIEAGNGGSIDLRNVTTIDGGRFSSAFQFFVHSGGGINLDSLTSTTAIDSTVGSSRSTWFRVEVPFYELPNLATAIQTRFDTLAFSTISLPSLTLLHNGRLDLPALASFEAPQLTDINGSFYRISGATIVTTGQLTNIDNTFLLAHNGGIVQVAANSFFANRNYGTTFMSASGANSRLNLDTVTSFRAVSGGQNTVEASTNGTIDLRGVEEIEGSSGGLRFLATSGGKINIGGISAGTDLVGGITRFESNLTNSVILFGSDMEMAANTRMTATLNGRFEAEGNLITRTQTPANFNMADGILRMIGSEPQFYEVAGTDNGLPTGSIGSNFQIGLMQIGTGTQQSTVILQDSFNNNANDSDFEALYLQGFPSEVGLRILGGSTLVLNGVETYVSNGAGGFFSARDMVPDGQIFTAFDGGFISLTGPAGQIINADASTDDTRGWSKQGPGNIEVVTKLGMVGGVFALTAGSPVEMTQHVSTLDQPFTIEFQARSLNSSGVLSLLLDGNVLQSWDHTELAGEELIQLSVPVNDPNLLGAIDVPFGFRWDGDTGHQVWVDNISMNGMGGDVLLGDVNLDGVVSLLDVAPFVNVLTSGMFQAEADVNQDGMVNLLDVAPFVEILTGG